VILDDLGYPHDLGSLHLDPKILSQIAPTAVHRTWHSIGINASPKRGFGQGIRFLARALVSGFWPRRAWPKWMIDIGKSYLNG